MYVRGFILTNVVKLSGISCCDWYVPTDLRREDGQHAVAYQSRRLHLQNFVRNFVQNNCAMQVTTISGFRANIKQYYDNVLLTEEPLIITKGDNGAVLIPLKEYNALQRRLELLGNTTFISDLKEGMRQVAQGQLIEVTDIDAL